MSADNVTIEFDGSNIIATKDSAGSDQDASVTMQIAIFASGVSPTPGGAEYHKGRSLCVLHYAQAICVPEPDLHAVMGKYRYW
jgi:hypothetical protein